MPSDSDSYDHCPLCRARVDHGFEPEHRGERPPAGGVSKCLALTVAFMSGVEASARHVANHSCVATCCDAQPAGGEARSLADCVRRHGEGMRDARIKTYRISISGTGEPSGWGAVAVALKMPDVKFAGVELELDSSLRVVGGKAVVK